VRLEGLGQLKKNNDFIGNRTRDLPAYSIVPPPFRSIAKENVRKGKIMDLH
jgi:hypothetical protein